jgi:hypothetical protein
MTLMQSKTYVLGLMEKGRCKIVAPGVLLRAYEATLWHALSQAEARAGVTQMAERYRLGHPDAARRVERAVFAGMSYAEIVDGFSTVDGEA